MKKRTFATHLMPPFWKKKSEWIITITLENIFNQTSIFFQKLV